MIKVEDEMQEKTLSKECFLDVRDFIILSVRSGFFSEKQIEEEIPYYLRSIWPDEPMIEGASFHRLVQELYHRYHYKGTVVYYNKLKTAFERLNDIGVVAEHLAGENMNEGFYNTTEIAEEKYKSGKSIIGVCFYTKRSLHYLLKGITPMLYLSYGNCFSEPTAMEIGWIIVRELLEAGLEVEWNGQPEKKIGIKNIIWDKKYKEN